MKYLFIFTLLFSGVANAGELCLTDQGSVQKLEEEVLTTQVPKHLEGATITITQKDGKTSTVPAEKFKVVPRVQQRLVSKVETVKTITCVDGTEEKINKNRLSVLAGLGRQKGLSVTTDGSNATVETNVGAVFGAQYQRLIDKNLSVGAQVQDNDTGSLLIGIDF